MVKPNPLHFTGTLAGLVLALAAAGAHAQAEEKTLKTTYFICSGKPYFSAC